LTIEQAIAEPMLAAGPMHPQGVSRASQAHQRIQELLDLVQLPSAYAERFPHELSGGERQRVGFARALALNPDLIIADEPTSALDVSVQETVLALFLQLQDELDFASLFISHDLAVIDMVSDYIAVMHRGKIVEHGEGGQVLTQPREEYTKQLIHDLPDVGKIYRG
jgi:peptide/nickel transport system ATP-binding protein